MKLCLFITLIVINLMQATLSLVELQFSQKVILSDYQFLQQNVSYKIPITFKETLIPKESYILLQLSNHFQIINGSISGCRYSIREQSSSTSCSSTFSQANKKYQIIFPSIYSQAKREQTDIIIEFIINNPSFPGQEIIDIFIKQNQTNIGSGSTSVIYTSPHLKYCSFTKPHQDLQGKQNSDRLTVSFTPTKKIFKDSVVIIGVDSSDYSDHTNLTCTGIRAQSFRVYTNYDTIWVMQAATMGFQMTAVPNIIQSLIVSSSSYIVNDLSNYTFAGILADYIPAGGRIQILFPETIKLINPSLVYSSFENNSCQVISSNSSNLLTIEGCFRSDMMNLNFSLTLSGIINPPSLQPTKSFSLSIFGPVGQVNKATTGMIINMLTLATSASFSIYPQSKGTNLITNYTLQFTFSVPHSNGDYFYLTLPQSMIFSTPAICIQVQGFGEVNCQTENLKFIRVTLIQVPTSIFSMTILNIRNPEKPTNISFTVTIYNSQGFAMQSTPISSVTYIASINTQSDSFQMNTLPLYALLLIFIIISICSKARYIQTKIITFLCGQLGLFSFIFCIILVCKIILHKQNIDEDFRSLILGVTICSLIFNVILGIIFAIYFKTKLSKDLEFQNWLQKQNKNLYVYRIILALTFVNYSSFRLLYCKLFHKSYFSMHMSDGSKLISFSKKCSLILLIFCIIPIIIVCSYLYKQSFSHFLLIDILVLNNLLIIFILLELLQNGNKLFEQIIPNSSPNANDRRRSDREQFNGNKVNQVQYERGSIQIINKPGLEDDERKILQQFLKAQKIANQLQVIRIGDEQIQHQKTTNKQKIRQNLYLLNLNLVSNNESS